ncbi:MAG: DNA-3-methyladenine glycosylase [Oscillospiraceae bacterium]|nr:DNA-3-methyladenine glycosylase [Oscillospiraceae bacterium]
MYSLGEKLNRAFFLRDCVTVARGLLGMHIVRETENAFIAVQITETEAYNGLDDMACHSYGGRITPRTQTFYMLGGHSYVYLLYGMHCLFNVITGDKNDPSGVLIRTGAIVCGRDEISLRRFGKSFDMLSNARKKQLLDGPGKICHAMGIDRSHNARDLLGEGLYLARPFDMPDFNIETGKRINIAYAGEAADYPYRFTMKTVNT